MKIPPGFQGNNTNLVRRMKKLLYGLKQAPRCWFAKLATTLTRNNIQLNVLIYMDDMIIAGNDQEANRTSKLTFENVSK